VIQEAVIVMTILGCGDQAQSCDYVTTAQTKWETKAQCYAAIPANLSEIQYVSYPVLTANCEVENTGSKVTSVEPLLEVVVLPEVTVFDELRDKADTIDIDLLGKVKASFASLVRAPRDVGAKIKQVFIAQ